MNMQGVEPRSSNGGPPSDDDDSLSPAPARRLKRPRFTRAETEINGTYVFSHMSLREGDDLLQWACNQAFRHSDVRYGLFTVFRCAPFPRKCLHTLLVFTRVHTNTEFVYKCTHDTASVCS